MAQSEADNSSRLTRTQFLEDPGEDGSEGPASYTTIDVARRLGVSVQTVQRWVDAGHLKAWKTLGGHRRIDARSAERLFRAGSNGKGRSVAKEDAPREAAHEASGPPSILVVDDHADDRIILKQLVQLAIPDAKVTLAQNGFDALLAIGRGKPDLIITDVVMPYMNGFAMVQYLSTHGSGPTPRIIAVSSYTADELRQFGQLPEGVPIFSKPLHSKSFVNAIRASLEHRPESLSEPL